MALQRGNRFRTYAWIFNLTALFAALVVYCCCTVKAGGNLWEILKISAAVMLLCVVPGYTVAQKVLGKLPFGALLCLSPALGIGILLCSYMLFGLLGFFQLCLLVPAALDIYFIVRLLRKKLTLPTTDTSPFVLGLFAVALVVYCFTAVLFNATTETLYNMIYHSDMLFYVGNAQGVAYGFPLTDLRFAGNTMHYHILNDATVGLLAYFTGTEAIRVMCFYFGPFLLVGAVCGLYQVGKLLLHHHDLALLFCIAVLFFNRDYKTSFYAFFVNTNSMLTTLFMTCSFLILLFMASEKNFEISWGHAALIVFSSAMLVLAKNITGLVMILAMLAALLFSICNHTFHSKLAWIVLGSAAAFAACYFGIFKGAAFYMEFQGTKYLLTTLVDMLQYFPLAFALFLANVVFCLHDIKQLQFSRVFTNAAFLGGLLAYALFHQWGTAHVYFAIMAIPFLWLCALWVLYALREKQNDYSTVLANFGRGWTKEIKTHRQQALALLLICGIAITCIPYVPSTSLRDIKGGVTNWIRMDRNVDIGITEEVVNNDDYAAMIWLRENTTPEDLMATNRNSRLRGSGDGTFHYYSAISGRKFYVEGWRFAIDYGADFNEAVHRLEEVSDGIFFNAASEEAAFALAKENGIDYLIVSLKVDDPGWSAVPVFENAAVKIYRVV